MTVNFTRSSKREPCPLCPDSDQHGDCRFSEGQNVILCHRHVDRPSLDAETTHYKYLHASKDQMWLRQGFRNRPAKKKPYLAVGQTFYQLIAS